MPALHRAAGGRGGAAGQHTGHGALHLGGERRSAQPDAERALHLLGREPPAGGLSGAVGGGTAVAVRGAGADAPPPVPAHHAGVDGVRLPLRHAPPVRGRGRRSLPAPAAAGAGAVPDGVHGGAGVLRHRRGGGAARPARAGGSAAVAAVSAGGQLPACGQ